MQAPLGKKSEYLSQYSPNLLFSIPRNQKRDEINVPTPLPFFGFDIWNAYEISWLNMKGKPIVMIAQFNISAASVNLIESKSFKLYLNSFNNTRFHSVENVAHTLINDLSSAVQGEVDVKLFSLNQIPGEQIKTFEGVCLDALDIACDTYEVCPQLLSLESEEYTQECVWSNLLKSNCLVTGQPDWASLFIEYKGPKIDKAGLLQYIVSYRNHNEFHEQCVERIFMDISQCCKPEVLTVYARYTRRGGLDINPIRSSKKIEVPENLRMPRQ